MTLKHRQLGQGRWLELSLAEQLANVGSEVERALAWRERNNAAYADLALDRALELLALTVGDPKNRKRLKELTRVREALVDFFCFDNQYRASPELWRKYFRAFNWAARAGR